MIIQTMSENLNKKPNPKRIDEDWVKNVVKKADLQKAGFTLNQNSNIVPVHMYMPIIKYEHVSQETFAKITVYRDNYKVEGLYVTDEQAKYKKSTYVFFTSSGFIGQEKVFFTIEDAIEAKKKRFKVKDVLEL